MKKILTYIMSLALVAALAIAGTVAFLTSHTSTKTNTFTVGSVEIELEEDVDVIGGGKVDEKEDGADYSDIVPGDKIKKEVKITNTGKNPAYVKATVVLNNVDIINESIDDYYENKGYSAQQIQAVYDNVFDGWGLNYSKVDADGDDAVMRLTITGDDMPQVTGNGHVITVDSTRTYTDNSVNYPKNMFMNAGEEDGHVPNLNDGYYSKDMNENELNYSYYIYLEPGDEVVLFNGLNIPTDFNGEQLAMFENLNIVVEADAIQADNFDDVKVAFETLAEEKAKANP